MNSETIFVEGKEYSFHSRREWRNGYVHGDEHRCINKRETRGEATSVCDVISLPFWREELPDAEKRPAPSMQFLIVDEILL